LKLKRTISIIGSILLLSSSLWAAPLFAADSVRSDLNQGHADVALQKLTTALAQNPADAEAHNLRCRVYYQEELWDQAIPDCEAAVRTNPSSSDYHLWLGRAYGQKAAHASLISAYKLAKKVAAEFQQAVQLDPQNTQALADLGEFDVSAPSIVGGGVSRAQVLAPKLQAVDAAAGFNLQAKIAEATKDYGTAESNLKFAIAHSSTAASAWVDLAGFYRRRGRMSEMVSALHNGTSLDHQHSAVLVDAADNLTAAHLEPQTAIHWLQQYLAAESLSEDAPAFAVRAKLARLLADEGDTSEAQRQLAAARSMASGYHIPARAFSSVAAR
jgi:tetratricopeptide (TPR) repeat protein